MAGTAAAAFAVGTAELLAGVLPAVPSLLEGVGGALVDATPPVVKDWSAVVLGTAGKAVLVVGILVACAAAGGAIGVLGARRRHVGDAAIGALGLAGGLAAASRGMVPGAVLAALVAAGAGAAALRWLLARADDDADLNRGPTPTPVGTALDRRRFVLGLAAVGAAAAVTGATGRLLVTRALDAADPSRILLPAAAAPRPPVTAEAALDVQGISPLFTPNDGFYRIDTALTIPRVDAMAWSLRVTGLVEREVELTYDDLLAMPLIESDITIACVSNEVGGPLVGTARWLGVRLGDVLDLAGPGPAATQVVGRSVDGFTAGFRTELARDGRDAMIAVGMNGAPLPARHGFPARLVVPGLFGYVSATKWLAELELTTWEAFDGYWVPRGWDKQARVLLQSRFDLPATGSQHPPGPVQLGGVAWEPEHGISGVEVAVDGGEWIAAELSADLGRSTWRQWRAVWEARKAGTHTLMVRAIDGEGRRQTSARFPVRPFGATGFHTIRVTIG